MVAKLPDLPLLQESLYKFVLGRAAAAARVAVFEVMMWSIAKAFLYVEDWGELNTIPLGAMITMQTVATFVFMKTYEIGMWYSDPRVVYFLSVERSGMTAAPLKVRHLPFIFAGFLSRAIIWHMVAPRLDQKVHGTIVDWFMTAATHLFMAQFIASALFYASHAMSHQEGFKWHHMFHHTRPRPQMVDVHSVSLFETAINATVFLMSVGIPTFIIGVDRLIVAKSFMIGQVFENIGHASAFRNVIDPNTGDRVVLFFHEVAFEWSWYLRGNTIQDHIEHHRSKKQVNYGLFFVTWDRLCGTELPIKPYRRVVGCQWLFSIATTVIWLAWMIQAKFWSGGVFFLCFCAVWFMIENQGCFVHGDGRASKARVCT